MRDAFRDTLDFTAARDNPGDYLTGVADVLAHLGFALIAAGVITRAQAVGFMEEVQAAIDRQARRLGVDPDAPRQRARKLPAEVLRRTFAMPVVGERNFGTIAGGKTEGPEPPAVA